MAYTEQQLKDAARKALAAGDTAAAKRLIDAARAAGAQAPKQKPAPTPAETVKPAPAPASAAPAGFEMGTGELMRSGPGPTGMIDPALYEMGAIGRRMQPGTPAPAAPNANVLEDVAKAGVAGLGRGAAMLADLPGAARELGMAGAEMVMGREMTPQERQIITGLTVPAAGQGDTRAKLEAATGGASEFRGNTTPGQYVGTVAEFAPSAAFLGGAGPVNMARNAVLPGLASEAAGQATEGTQLEGAARFAGALIGGVAPDIVNFGTKSFQNAFRMSAEKPTVESLRTVKNIAYKAVDEAGETFSPQELQVASQRAVEAMGEFNFLPEVDRVTAGKLEQFAKLAERPLTLGQLDKFRQSVWQRYNATKEVGLLDIIDSIDELILSRESTSELLTAARVANSRYKKAELLDTAFTKAADQTGSTGSGGNILNKYRQAVTSIINNPKQARWFTAEEIEVMRQFVRGTPSQNTLRLIGKLAPSGNGLMTALNLGAAGAWGAPALAVAGLASGAKAIADSSQGRAAEGLIDMVATGQMPQRAMSGTPNLALPVAGIGAISDARR